VACQHLSSETNLRECEDQSCFEVQAVPVFPFCLHVPWVENHWLGNPEMLQRNNFHGVLDTVGRGEGTGRIKGRENGGRTQENEREGEY
jgi:hypothetical protein